MNFLNIVFRLAYISSYRRFCKVVCISKAIASDLRSDLRIGFSHSIRVIYNPHDAAAVVSKSLEPLTASEEKQLGERPVVFLGRISPVKGLHHLIRSFSLLATEFRSTRLVIIGDGDAALVGDLRALAKKLGLNGRVSFLGPQVNPYKFLRHASALAITSQYEGTPNVIVEAIALGVPVVSTNCTAGIQEMMALTIPTRLQNSLVTEAGLITPPFSQAGLNFRSEEQTQSEERSYASALSTVLGSGFYANRTRANRSALLKKFCPDFAASAYLAAK